MSLLVVAEHDHASLKSATDESTIAALRRAGAAATATLMARLLDLG